MHSIRGMRYLRFSTVTLATGTDGPEHHLLEACLNTQVTSRWDSTIKALRYETDGMAIVGRPLLDIDVGVTEQGAVGRTEEHTKSIDSEIEVEIVIADDLQEMREPESSLSQAANEEKFRASSPGPQTYKTSSRARVGSMTHGVRHMFKSVGLEVTDIQGTERDGRISKEDIQRDISETSSPSPPTSSPKVTTMPQISSEDRLVSLTLTENAMFKTMTRSVTISHFLYTVPSM
ncbi:uncharacterized protein BDZ99DRAFT_480273 [Mytilinidion resinicola]|uniref:Peripheral subunit-binding (PSBD) domain-containing protein n=1 Tax=Mytilinidion resinicola TaxID=574789 RepID=A0A6A6YAP6_9PEZI|nr:uncharacterized protein BDZ99DRAFT_480273 [Mytilinidion resinicola]KAF2805573.1 hypothetical protein BDZ99DRAFT_480273 [Mytilinidion resinicola]